MAGTRGSPSTAAVAKLAISTKLLVQTVTVSVDVRNTSQRLVRSARFATMRTWGLVKLGTSLEVF